MAVLGQDSGSYTPQDVERKRRWAEILLKGGEPAREPFGALAQGLRGAMAGWNDYEADQAESIGQKSVAELLQKGDWQSALGNEWTSPQQSAIAAMLQGREWELGDRNAQWAREDAIRADQQDDPRLFQFDDRIVSVAPDNSVSEVYTNPRGETVDPATIVTVYDANGREQKGYMDGTNFVPVGSPKAQTERPEFTVSQATAAGYADRMAQADAILTDPALSQVQTDVTQRTLGGVPLVGNMMVSPEYQQAEQAQRDFINAILRRESGAVISDSEFANARRQYFPQPGDSQAVLEQKAANRRNSIAGVSRAAGPAYAAPDTTNYLEAPPGLPTGPGIGAVEDGYRFKGGDPSDPNSWEQI